MQKDSWYINSLLDNSTFHLNKLNPEARVDTIDFENEDENLRQKNQYKNIFLIS